jgi:hypothetical protein
MALMMAAITIVIGLLLLSQSRDSRIAYHLSGLRSAQMSFSRPTSLKDYFSEQGLKWLRSKGDWLIHGCRWHSDDERRKAAEEHRQALLRLAYFEQREFMVNCALGDRGYADWQFNGMLRGLPLRCQLWQIEFTPLDESSQITVCASVADMVLWERLIGDFNSQTGAVE